MAKYERKPVAAPRLSGIALKAFISAAESPLAGPPLLTKLVKDSGIDGFRAADPGSATPLQVPLPFPDSLPVPVTPQELAKQAQAVKPTAKLPNAETAARFTEAYQSGATDPTRVVRALQGQIEKLDGGDEPMHFFIARKKEEALKAAEASAERWRKGEPLSALDGVPVVVKDEIDLAGFPTTLGTSWRKQVSATDSTVAARLKAAGAVILGKANMNEIGINPIGLNPHHGVCRNPYDRHRITGGSSSGSAATVAAGIAPVSIGLDGGGSIRIPAALCGVAGLKATFGRISERGVPPLCWNPGHIGPIGLTVQDVATCYALIAGPDEHEFVSQRQPPVNLGGFEQLDASGVRLGICWPYFEDADPLVVARCKAAVKALEAAGAKVVELPAPDLNTILWSHSIIILSEMADSMLPELVNGGSARFALDSRINLAIARNFKSTDYVHAMRHRQKLTLEYLSLMRDCDVVVTPTTATVAPPIPEDSLPDGDSNLPVVDGLMRFVRVGNLTGFPALSVPVGEAEHGMPASLQLMGRPWEEHLLLRLGRVVEASVERKQPAVHVSVL
ncbi:MAG: amidase [Myxococcaceae bacterium]